MNDLNVEEFEQRTNYSFVNKKLLKLALTHSSYANEMKRNNYENNERLEFLGDAVLDMVVSEYMYSKFPYMLEGELTKLRAAVVCEASLAGLARNISLGNYLLLGKGEESTGGRNRDSILADTYEAVIGAITMDGGVEQASKYILNFLVPELEKTKNNFHTLDCKTHLQEVIQKTSKMPLNYRIVDEHGPDHNKIFVAEVSHGTKVLGKGQGKSKKEAEQIAAHDALKNMKILE